MDPSFARDIALGSAGRLAALIRPNGKFVYRYDAISGAALPGYNILRHAGAVWVLGKARAAGLADPQALAATRKALVWQLTTKLSASPQHGWCIVERGKIKLGASALTILAVLSVANDNPPGADSDLIRGLCAHIVAQIDSSGDFVHKRDAATGAADTFRSDYYTGQALFALLAAHAKAGDPGLLSLVRERLRHLAGAKYGVAQQSHWMMYAIERAFALWPDAYLFDYAAAICAHILDVPAYREAQRCTPIACRSEALLVYLRLLSRVGLRGSSAFAQVAAAVEVNLGLQLRDHLPDGAFRQGADSSTVRIDYLQHNIATLLDYAAVRVTPEGKRPRRTQGFS